MSFLTPVRNYVDALVHPSAQQDALTAARHRAFIAPRLLGSFAALASLPGLYRLARRAERARSRRVRLAGGADPDRLFPLAHRPLRKRARAVLALAHRPGGGGGRCTGGIGSFAAIWLVVVPLEAALSASRRVVALASTFALAAAGLLLVLERARPAAAGDRRWRTSMARWPRSASSPPRSTPPALRSAPSLLARTSVWLLYAEEDRYRLLARNMTDVITRHGRNGAVLFVSPAAEPLFGVRGSELAGHGLFDRVHVADRPAYLTALADAAALGEDRSVEFRIRRDSDAEPHGGHFVWVEMRCRPLEPRHGCRETRRARGGRGAARRDRAQGAGARARDRRATSRSAPTPRKAASSPP